jgi:excisionase family DNA binding protein
MSNEPLYKIDQVAERLNISISTLYRLVASGRIEHHRIGCGRGAIRFSESQVRAYMAKTERKLLPAGAPRVRLKHLRI